MARPGAPGQARQGPPGAGGSVGHGGRSGSVASNGSDPSDLRQRYQRSPPEGGRAGGGAATRPVSGVFSLDLAKIEGDKERLSEVGSYLNLSIPKERGLGYYIN